MWLAVGRLVWKFRKPVALALVGVLIALAIRGYGNRRYEAGEVAANASWQSRFEQAWREKAAAEARSAAIARASEANRLDLEKSHAATRRELQTSTAQSAVRIHGLVRQLTARPVGCEVPAVAAGDSADARDAALERRLAEIGERIAGVGRDCQLDAASLNEWQQWYRGESALRQ